MKLYCALVAATLVATPAFAAPVISFSVNSTPYAYPLQPVNMTFTTTRPGIISGTINEFKALNPQAGIAYISGPSGTFNFASTYLSKPTGTLSLVPIHIAAGTYSFYFKNTSYDGFDGSVDFTATPEPSTWALMILGFGAVGFAMRRQARRQQVKVVYA